MFLLDVISDNPIPKPDFITNECLAAVAVIAVALIVIPLIIVFKKK